MFKNLESYTNPDYQTGSRTPEALSAGELGEEDGRKGGKKKPARKPSKKDCLEALDDLNALLNANEPNENPRRLHKSRTFVNDDGFSYSEDKITKGVKVRYRQLRQDSGRLYENRPEGPNSYKGHQDQYRKVRAALKQTMDLIDGDCKDEINKWLEQQTPEVRAKYEEMMQDGKDWIKREPPSEPDRVRQRERPQEPTPQPAPAPSPDPSINNQWSPPVIDPWWIIPAGGSLLWRMIFPIEGQGIQVSLPRVNSSDASKGNNGKAYLQAEKIINLALGDRVTSNPESNFKLFVKLQGEKIDSDTVAAIGREYLREHVSDPQAIVAKIMTSANQLQNS